MVFNKSVVIFYICILILFQNRGKSMPSKKKVIVAHGIGDAKPDFFEEWKKILHENHDSSKFEVIGFHWEPVLQKIADKYPLIPKELIEKCGFDQLKSATDSSNYKVFSDYLMDVLVYVLGGGDMAQYILDECILKLNELTKGHEQDTILIGHSLGAAMLPHITWREWDKLGAITYKGMILMSCPLGFESPAPALASDLLDILGKIAGGDRISTLKLMANVWRSKGNNALCIINNVNDIVCSDVQFGIDDKLIDLIPIRQGFSAYERQVINKAFPGSLKYINFGKPGPNNISDNHDVKKYLGSKEFIAAFEALLK